MLTFQKVVSMMEKMADKIEGEAEKELLGYEEGRLCEGKWQPGDWSNKHGDQQHQSNRGYLESEKINRPT